MTQTRSSPLHPSPSQLLPRVCVIGAGSSGLSAIKALKEKGFSPVCYETGNLVGGLWAIDNDNQRGGAYRSLSINTSARKTEFSDFPMDSAGGDFPSHDKIATYFRDYAAHFDLVSSIQFNQQVQRCTPLIAPSNLPGQSQGEGGYRLRVADRSTGEIREEDFAAVVVANGHHFQPSYPTPKPDQTYVGLVMHAGEYLDPQTPHDLRAKRVLVVGIGNSAVDIACELYKNGASSVDVSARRGAWVLPKYILGKPLDQGGRIPQWLPPKLRRHVVTATFRMLFGKMSDYGLPTPDHLIGEAHPTISDEFPHLVKDGRIKMRRAIQSFHDLEVRFEDGATSSYDAILYATGYQVSFPFFDSTHLAAPENHIPLYHRAFHPDLRHVFFVGLAQTIGAIMPVAEAQSQAIALHLAGEFNLPPAKEMRKAIEEEERWMAQRFVTSPRHTMQVEPTKFHRNLRRDLKRGKQRASQGQGLSFPSAQQKESP